MLSVDIPPALARRLRFRARRNHCSFDVELARCLHAGIDTLARKDERFRRKAPRLRQKVGGFLRRRQLQQHISSGRV